MEVAAGFVRDAQAVGSTFHRDGFRGLGVLRASQSPRARLFNLLASTAYGLAIRLAIFGLCRTRIVGAARARARACVCVCVCAPVCC